MSHFLKTLHRFFRRKKIKEPLFECYVDGKFYKLVKQDKHTGKICIDELPYGTISFQEADARNYRLENGKIVPVKEIIAR